jgi:hypothetical protein
VADANLQRDLNTAAVVASLEPVGPRSEGEVEDETEKEPKLEAQTQTVAAFCRNDLMDCMRRKETKLWTSWWLEWTQHA